jgi:hypothetical protein
LDFGPYLAVGNLYVYYITDEIGQKINNGNIEITT